MMERLRDLPLEDFAHLDLFEESSEVEKRMDRAVAQYSC